MRLRLRNSLKSLGFKAGVFPKMSIWYEMYIYFVNEMPSSLLRTCVPQRSVKLVPFLAVQLCGGGGLLAGDLETLVSAFYSRLWGPGLLSFSFAKAFCQLFLILVKPTLQRKLELQISSIWFCPFNYLLAVMLTTHSTMYGKTAVGSDLRPQKASQGQDGILNHCVPSLINIP